LRCIRESVMAHRGAASVLSLARVEQTFSWMENGLQHKCRCDVVNGDVIADLKTCGDASPRAVRNSVLRFGYHIQAAHYLRGTGAQRFVLIFVEKTAPYLTAVYELDAEALASGRTARQDAICLFEACSASGVWPGYSSEIESLSLPVWASTEEEE